MTDRPNPADFSADDRPREFRATIEVRGTMLVTIEADSIEEARSKAADMAAALDNEPTEIDLDGVDDVRVRYVSKSPTMYRITRGDAVMQVSRLEPGDMPRQPDARGF